MKKQLFALAIVAIFFLVLLWGVDYLGFWLYRGLEELLPGGVRVTFYEGTDFEKRVCVRSSRALVAGYGTGKPALGVPADGYSVRFTGILQVPETAEYFFFMQSLQGAKLYIGDHLVIDNWKPDNWITGAHGSVCLTNGAHSVRLDLYKETGEGAVRVKWTGGPIPPNTLMKAPYLKKE